MVTATAAPTAPETGSLPRTATRLFKRVGFESHPEQMAILDDEHQYKLTSGGEQAGKSLTASKELLIRWQEDLAFKIDDNFTGGLLYWLVSNDYSGTEQEFRYIEADFVALFGSERVDATKRVDPGYIHVYVSPEDKRPFIRVETKSAKDIHSLRKEAPHGFLICEASQVDYSVWERCRGRSAPRDAWIFMSGTFEKGNPWYIQMFQAWRNGSGNSKSFKLPATSNRALYPGGEKDPKILALKDGPDAVSDDYYTERIDGEPVPPRGLVIKNFRPDFHIRDLEYVPGLPVFIWEDPGYDGAHAIEASQYVDWQVRVFDEIYVTGLIHEDVIDLVQQREWWAAEDKVLVSDPHYKSQHHSRTSVEEVWLSETGLRALGDKVQINEGSERFMSFLKVNPLTGVPKMVISPKCRGLLSELGAGLNPITKKLEPYVWQVDGDGTNVGKTPIDRNNHAIKAVIYGLIKQFGYSRARRGNRGKVVRF